VAKIAAGLRCLWAPRRRHRLVGQQLNEKRQPLHALDQITAGECCETFKRRGAIFISSPAGLYRPAEDDEEIPVIIGQLQCISLGLWRDPPRGRDHRPSRTGNSSFPITTCRPSAGLAIPGPAGNGAQPQIIFGGAVGGMYSINASKRRVERFAFGQ